jgi:hypothetical protein
VKIRLMLVSDQLRVRRNDAVVGIEIRNRINCML